MHIGDRIKKLRIEKGMKQADLAEAANISRVAVGNYERGDRTPDAYILKNLAEALDCRTDYLIGATSSPQAEIAVVSGDLVINDEYRYLTGNKFIEKLKEDYPNIKTEIRPDGTILILSTDETNLAPMRQARLLYLFDMLSFEGQNKILNYADDLAQTDKNRKKEGDTNAEKD